ncbi:hypothetical protein JZM37_03795 [Acinetobacter pittii]|uniref:hypothetical protein n=1 Tax=Acinetobacter pittii TaxID=48296 RepID=UPI00197E1FFE|nr:hypothetical protein [Acinetobacter pittii]MBN6523378.1 hypothetical protein [Acinetobacter pittii]
MESLYIFIIATIIPLLAILINKLFIDKVLNKNKRTIIFNKSGNKKDEVYVPSNFNDDEIDKKIQSSILFESDILKEIKKMIIFYPDVLVEEGNSVDFILKHDNLKIAIECKVSFNHLNPKLIEKYFNDQSDIDNLILVSMESINENIKKKIYSFSSKKNIEIIDNYKGFSDKILINEIKKDLKLV